MTVLLPVKIKCRKDSFEFGEKSMAKFCEV